MGYSMTAGLRADTIDTIEEILAALSLSSVEMHHLHTEGVDQLEIALAPLRHCHHCRQ